MALIFKNSLLWGKAFCNPPGYLKSVFRTGPGLSAGQLKGQEIDEIIQGAADQYGVDPALIKAIISVESNRNPKAISHGRCPGINAIDAQDGAELGVTDPFDPAQNIRAGTRYLSRLLDRYQGNQKLALAAYNWGMGNLEKNPSGLAERNPELYRPSGEAVSILSEFHFNDLTKLFRAFLPIIFGILIDKWSAIFLYF